jgi:hypothetical protein
MLGPGPSSTRGGMLNSWLSDSLFIISVFILLTLWFAADQIQLHILSILSSLYRTINNRTLISSPKVSPRSLEYYWFFPGLSRWKPPADQDRSRSSVRPGNLQRETMIIEFLYRRK